MSAQTLRAARANRVFGTDEKRIRTENTVIDKNKNSSEVLSKIVDCVRMCFSSARNRRSARTGRRPRNSSATVRSVLQSLSMSTCDHCALRAPTLFSVRMKSASVQKTRFWKKQGRFGLLSRIDDPRGRAAVRAIAEMDDDKGSRPDRFGFVRRGY